MVTLDLLIPKLFLFMMKNLKDGLDVFFIIFRNSNFVKTWGFCTHSVQLGASFELSNTAFQTIFHIFLIRGTPMFLGGPEN